jgi:hypothetical protein
VSCRASDRYGTPRVHGELQRRLSDGPVRSVARALGCDGSDEAVLTAEIVAVYQQAL